MNSKKIHESVMVGEVLDSLHIKNQALPAQAGKYIDATLGTGGHTEAIALKGGLVLGIERDPLMLKLAIERLEACPTPKLVLGNFIEIDKISRKFNFSPVDGILLDLGVTNLHLTNDNRGFSFTEPDNVLDMRMNPKIQGVTAYDLLNVLRKDQLEKLFDITMERSSSRWLSKQIIENRTIKSFKTTGDLLDICEGLKYQKSKLNKSTLPFLALRIAVNNELDNLVEVLPKAYSLLKPGGKLLVITFHSGEEKIVKDFDKKSEVRVVSEEEVEKNPRARSAKLRIITKKYEN